MGETLPEFCRRVGKSRLTVWRWIKDGLSIGGRVVKLAAVRVGGRWQVPTEAWEAFQRGCNPGARPLPESPSAMDRRAAAARRAALAAVGLQPERGAS